MENGLEALKAREQAVERSLIKNVYLWMAGGLALTAGVAHLTLITGLFYKIVTNPILFYGLIIGELVLVFSLSARINKIQPQTAALLFISYAALNGLTLSTIFIVYSIGVITQAFISTAALFGAMSLWGATTKRNLSGMGHYLFMGLVGILIVSLLNIFFRSSQIDLFISYGGVILFTLLTAYDTQKILNLSRQQQSYNGEGTFQKLSILGALTLYLDFINIFLYLLRILGRRE